MKSKTKAELMAELEGARQNLQHMQELETKCAQLAQALEESEGRYRLIADNVTDIIWTMDMDLRLTYVSPSVTSVLGYPVDEIMEKDLGELLPLKSNRQAVEAFKARLETQRMETDGVDRALTLQLELYCQDGRTAWTETRLTFLYDSQGQPNGILGVTRDITSQKQTELALRQALNTLQERTRALAALNQAGQTLTSTLALDQVLAAVLDEVRYLLGVVACSVWLVDPDSGELVCKGSSGPQRELVLGWRMPPGEGLVGWVARTGESLNVRDTWADDRHFRDVDRRTGLMLRSILTVPLRLKERTIGVLQALDSQPDRFTTMDSMLLDLLAGPVAIAIENARLYERAQQDAEAKATLLHEVNHRVKNNLIAIVGLLYAARRHAKAEDQSAYESVIGEVINWIQGLIAVHNLLSESQWEPILLSDLASQTIQSCVNTYARNRCVTWTVTPSAVKVTADQAHHLALVFNELITNALKHVDQDHDPLHVHISISSEGDWSCVEFRDNGPGYTEDTLQLKKYNMGFDLIQNIVRKVLRGELTLRNDAGAVVTIRFKTRIPPCEEGLYEGP